MEKNEKNYFVRISKESNEILNNLSDSRKISKSKLINILIKKEVEKKIDFLSNEKKSKEVIVKTRIRENEKDFLIEQAQKNGSKSLSSEIKYRLLNSMYKNIFFTPNEYKNLYAIRNELIFLGRNLNQILKRLNRVVNPEFDEKEMKENISLLDKKLNEVELFIQEYIRNYQKRF